MAIGQYDPLEVEANIKRQYDFGRKEGAKSGTPSDFFILDDLLPKIEVAIDGKSGGFEFETNKEVKPGQQIRIYCGNAVFTARVNKVKTLTDENSTAIRYSVDLTGICFSNPN